MVVVDTVEVDLIDQGSRLRPVDETTVPALAGSLTREGLLQAIGVRKSGQLGARYTLIWGAHRLAAARLLGWSWITAKVYEAKDLPAGVSAVELEALENLSRSELSPYDRAMTIKGLREEILRAAGLTEGQDARAVGGFARDENTQPANFAVSDLAERIGLSLRTVEDALWLAKMLRPATAAAMRGREGWRTASIVMDCVKVGDQLVDAMAAEKKYIFGQDALVDWLSSNPESGLKAALSALAPKVAVVLTPSDKATHAVVGNFNRVRGQDRVAVLGQLCQTLTPGQRKELLVALDAAWQDDALAAVGANAS